MPPAAPLTATTILARIKSRTELREFLLNELPGWDPWFVWAAATVQRDTWDYHLLKTEKQLIKDIETFAEEFAAAFGDEAEDLFMPFTQQRPDYPLAREHAAVEPFTSTRGDLPFSHADLTTRMPSRVLIGLVGALGLLRLQSDTGERKSGRRENRRLTRALRLVCDTLVPFRRDNAQMVAPALDYREVAFPDTAYRSKPVTLALAALVAVYLSLPNRDDSDAPSDPDRLELAATLQEETIHRLRLLTRQQSASVEAEFDIEAALAEQQLAQRVIEITDVALASEPASQERESDAVTADPGKTEI